MQLSFNVWLTLRGCCCSSQHWTKTITMPPWLMLDTMPRRQHLVIYPPPLVNPTELIRTDVHCQRIGSAMWIPTQVTSITSTRLRKRVAGVIRMTPHTTMMKSKKNNRLPKPVIRHPLTSQDLQKLRLKEEVLAAHPSRRMYPLPREDRCSQVGTL
jgi:hypothetical protein